MACSKAALWATGHEEAVGVNQRALIDKILARYSGEFSLFRELLQNSDDAGASSVEIRFETKEYLSQEKGDEPKPKDLPDLKTAVVHQWTFKNNGMLFREEDWNRLKKIADGNPDEEKIGAFGVGFYSLFSITEEPWVTSGGKWMNFYWKDKKNQLHVRRGTGGDTVDAWTTFQMTLREPGPMAPAFDFTRFLVSSIAFMTHLSEVSVYFDDKRLARLSKNRGESKEVPMLKGLKEISPKGMMSVKSVTTTFLQIEAEVVELVYKVGSEKPSVMPKTDTLMSSPHEADGFFSPLSDGFEASPTPQGTPTQVPVAHKESTHLLEANSSNIDLTIFAANVDVRVDKKMAGELVRATKKNPPSRLRYELIYTGKDEHDSSVRAEEEAAYATGSVFQGLRADLEGSGSARVFIGHSTGQTTGIGGHIATRFIPTVERESIDLVDRNVAVWNKELLYVGGFLARSVYELELDAVQRLWKAAASNGADGHPDEKDQTRLRGRALHALKFFSFHPSTPSPMVSDLMETAFFACSTTRPFPIIASDGVRNSSEVYILQPEFSGFIKRLPVISADVLDGAKTMIATLRSRKMIKNITFVSVLDELRSRPLSETETVECLKWWIGVTKEGNNHDVPQERSQLLNALVVSVTGRPEKTMRLSDAQTFLKSRTSEAIIPTIGPLPRTLLPTGITRLFDQDTLTSAFLWRQLSIIDWLRHLTDPKVAAANPEFDVAKSALWAERVLSVLVRAWPSLTETDKKGVIGILSPMSCIPTTAGLKAPNQAYFPNTELLNLFRDLPIVKMPSGAIVEGTLELVLQALCVRKHVELRIIVERMVETGDWTTYDLVNYMMSIQPTLTPQESVCLRQIQAFKRENTRRERWAAVASRYKVTNLYEPTELFRELGLPIIDWGSDNQWDPKSEIARFIFSLGLRRAPPLNEILLLAASDNPTVQTKALTYFLDNFNDMYRSYNSQHFSSLAFVPAVLGWKKVLAKPLKVCTDPKWSALGFAVVDPILPDGAASKLGLENRPRDSDLVTLLERYPPADETTARKWFEILSDCVSEFSIDYLRKLSETPFVPVESTGYKGGIKRLQPRQCFLGKQRSELHSKLFAFVNFGTRANGFLKCCYISEEPSAEDIAQVLLTDPWRVYKLANGRKNYLPLLHELAKERDKLEEGTILRMKQSKILLGFRRVPAKRGGKDSRYFPDELFQPSEVVIGDDTNACQLFGDRIYCAPQDDIIEELYLFLGSPNLSSLIREDHKTSRELVDSKIAVKIRQLILDRLPLFLHKQSPSRTRLSPDWLNNDKNLIVREFEKITVIKSLHHGNIEESASCDASAIAKQEGSEPIELLLAKKKQLELHEISNSLCRVIFMSSEARDAALFMTILQADLTNLEKLGYPVGRISRQRAEREAAEKLNQTESSTTQPKTSKRSFGYGLSQLPKGLIVFLFCLAFLRKSEDVPPRSESVPPPSPIVPTTQPEILSSEVSPGNTASEKTSFGPGRHKAPNRLDAPSGPPESEDIPPLSKPAPPPPSPNIPNIQPEMIRAPSEEKIPVNTAQTPKYSSGPGDHRAPNHPLADTASPQPIPFGPPERENIPHRSKPVQTPPSPNMPTTPPEMPLLDMPMPTASSQVIPRDTGHEQTSESSYGPACHQPSNGTDVPPSCPAPPPESEDEPPRSKSVPPMPSPNIPERECLSPKPGSPTDCITPLSSIAYSVNKAIKRCTPERGNLLRNLANNINRAVGAGASESDGLLLELANDINVTIEASVPASDKLLKRLLHNINSAIGASSSERDDYLRSLANNIEMAIEAGMPASGTPFTNQEEMMSLDERYCDVTGETMDLGLAGSMCGIDVFAASDLPEPELLMKQKHDVLARFLEILKPLISVYEIPQTSLHIFADEGGRFISFNRRGTLFINLRYFEEYHDKDVEQGNLGEALTFWYFILAHGICHNVVDPHDLEHEVLVSAICGKYLEQLIDLLS